MYSPPNELYTAFSFIGFLLCVIPLYWHLESWNTGTCLYMIWVGLGCLLQCINSILWNKNMINRAPVYCDISARVQAALNAAIPACSLCINRRLYKAATAKTAMFTNADKRRAVIQDLLIGVGIPILQMVAEYIVSSNRYDIFEDFGPHFAIVHTPLTFILFFSWPLVSGSVSFYYCVRAIYAFYKRQRQSGQIMMSSQGLSRGRYLRLMALSSIEVLGTIPIGTYILALESEGVGPWESWALMRSHYSEVKQVPRHIWKNGRRPAEDPEMFRWLLVAGAFIFFSFFGLADDARQHYRRVYMSLASRIGYPKSTLRGSSYATTSVPYMKTRRNWGVHVSVVTTGGEKHRSNLPLIDKHSSLSSSIFSGPRLDLKIDHHSPSDTVISSSMESFDEESRTQGRSNPLAEIMPTVPLASVPPHFPEKSQPTIRAHSGIDAV